MSRRVLLLLLVASAGCRGNIESPPAPGNDTNPNFITPEEAAKQFQPDPKHDAVVMWAGSRSGGAERDQNQAGWPVTELKLYNTKITDKDLVEGIRLLPDPQKLRVLDLQGSSVSEFGLRSLTPLTGLTTLNLNQCRVSDPGLAHLAKVPLLTFLSLSEVKTLNGTGLKHVPKHMARLHLMQSGVTDDGLKTLPELAGLQELMLNDTAIGDEGVRSLSKFTALETLDLSGTRITDAAASVLAQLPKLQSLTVSGTSLSNTGLKTLAGSNSLQSIIANDTKITAAGIQECRRLRPQCQIAGP